MEEHDQMQENGTPEKEASAIEQQLQECLMQKDEWKDRCLRNAAEFENYKRRSEKERVGWITNTQAALLTDIIGIADDFERARLRLSGPSHPTHKASEDRPGSLALRSSKSEVEASSIGQASTSADLEGFSMIYKQFQKLLEKYGVQEIKEVTEFDPHLHEAIMQVESPGHTAGQIVQVLQKGYRFKDQILRPAKVSVAR